MFSVGVLFLGCAVLTEAFFFFEDDEPILFCIKVCPLYCTPRRRRDTDASSLIYIDHVPYIPYHEDHDDHEYLEDHVYHEVPEVVPYHFDPYYFCKPKKPTTTTPAPTTMATTTTTDEPSGICMFCMKKCTKYPKAKKS